MLTRQLNVLVVDDEPLARKRLVRLVSLDPDFAIVGSVGSAGEIGQLDPTDAIDIVLLDIRLPGGDGFHILELIHQRGLDPFVIFVTAYSEHAVAAFEVEAVDYLLKPFTETRFAKALARAKVIVTQAEEAGQASPKSESPPPSQPTRRFPGRILISDGGKILFLSTHAIEYIQAAGKTVRVFTQGQSHTVREPLHEIEARLDANQFVRIHRSTIVNIEQISELHPLFHGDCELVLRKGARLTMSRRYRERLAPFLT